MSADLNPKRAKVRFFRRIFPTLLAGTVLLLTGCADQPTDPGTSLTAVLAMATEFPDGATSQASFVDAWRVQVSRPSEGVIAEDSGTIDLQQQTVSVQLTVTLEASCERLSIRVELSAGGQVWFRSEDNREVCAGPGTEIQTAQMVWVRPSATVTPGTLAFTVQEGQQANGNITISYPGTDDLSWTAWILEGNAPWLIVQPSGGSATSGQPGQITVTADAGELSPGQYSAHVVVVGDGFPLPLAQIPVTLTVTEGPELDLYPMEPLSFTVFSGLDPDQRTMAVTNSGGGTLSWTATDDVGWLSVYPASGSLGAGQTQEVTVTVASSQLEAGAYQATITVQDPAARNSPQTVTADLLVRQRAMIGLDPTSLTFSAPEGTSPWEQYIQLTNLGGSTLNWTVTDDAPWLTVVPNVGVLPVIMGVGLSTQLTVLVNSASLAPGSYQATITFSDPDAGNSPQTLPVNLTVVPPQPPVISGFGATLLELNDTTCWNSGSRFEFRFDYEDPDGDLPISAGQFSGNPMELSWQFLPAGFSGTGDTTAVVVGNEFAGEATFELCIAYQVEANTSVTIAIRLMDAGENISNTLGVNIPRPEGANTPPQEPESSAGDTLPGLLPTRRGGGIPPP